MVSANFIAILVSLLVLLQPWTATPNFLSPLLSPVLDDVCKDVNCGKGTCKPSGNSTFLYECECNPGWNQSGLSFLPCVIPNCSINYSCTEAAPPVQDKESGANKSIIDPCHWMDCGGGWCNKTSIVTYKCECRQNYYNLLNASVFPCFQECALGMDCSNLGISFGKNRSTSAPPSMADNTNHASSIPRGNINWSIMLLMILTTFLWK